MSHCFLFHLFTIYVQHTHLTRFISTFYFLFALFKKYKLLATDIFFNNNGKIVYIHGASTRTRSFHRQLFRVLLQINMTFMIPRDSKPLMFYNFNMRTACYRYI